MPNLVTRFFKGFSFLRGVDGASQISSRYVRSPLYISPRPRDLDNNTIIQACLRWAARNFPEPPLYVWKLDKNGIDTPLVEDPLSRLLMRPLGGVQTENKTSYRLLMSGLITSLILDGNGYLHKLRSASDKVIGLSSLSPWDVEPVGKNGQLLAYDVRQPNGSLARISPNDIVHVMDGVDPSNPHKACSPLKSVMRLALSDNEIAVYTWSILKRPHPSMMISPKDAVSMDEDQLDQLQRRIDEQTADERSGGVMMLTAPMSVDKLTITPEDMALDKLSRLPEERITAVIGIPAIVAGLGAGLERSTYSNYQEARKAATEDFLVPYWKLVAEQISNQMIDDQSGMTRFNFDLRDVRAMQEDENDRHSRIREDFSANLIDRAEARAGIGLEVLPHDVDVWAWQLRPMGATLPQTASKTLSKTLRSQVEGEL